MERHIHDICIKSNKKESIQNEAFNIWLKHFTECRHNKSIPTFVWSYDGTCGIIFKKYVYISCGFIRFDIFTSLWTYIDCCQIWFMFQTIHIKNFSTHILKNGMNRCSKKFYSRFFWISVVRCWRLLIEFREI